jgi:hypothetical protein
MSVRTNRAIAAAAAAAIALTSVSFAPAMAAPVSKGQTVAADNTDFSARRKRYRGHSHGNRAAIGAFLGIAGTIAALAARDRYYRDYGYGPYYGYAPYSHYGYAPYYAHPAPYGYVPY